MSAQKKFEQIRAFTASGDLRRACKLAQAALKKHPKDIAIALAYAEALLGSNEHATAATVLAKFTTSTTAPVDLYLMRAYALMQVQQPDEGLHTVIAGLRIHRDHPELLNHAGVLCAELKRPVDAESWFRRLSEVQPRRSEAFLGLGNALREQGESKEALQAYNAAIDLEPMNPSPQVNRANLLAEMGEHDTARGAYQDILQRFPQRKDVLSNLAASLAATDDHRGAAKLYSEYLAIHPQDLDAGLSMAKALLKSGDAKASKNVLENMARVWPERTEICPELINACLRSDDEAQARHFQSVYKQNFPTSADVYSCDTILDIATGARDISRNEASYDADIEPAQLEIPTAYDSADAFWDEVCTAVYAHPSLRESPAENATREGFHSDNLAEEPVAPALQDLIAAIKTQVEQYAAKRADAGNPFYAGLNLEGSLFRMWAVVMRKGGHQEAHIHPSSRISGVVYAKVPATIRDDNERAGWIEFGRPHADFFQPETLATRMCQPQLGRIVLFPAYLYHRTLPLDGSDHRISIAFDVCTPERARNDQAN